MLKRTLLALVLALVALDANAADHFIRDGATGTSPCTGGWGSANACDDLPATLTRGDTYWIADGTYNTNIYSQAASGTTLITIKKATVASHGSATNWLDSYGDGQAELGHWIAITTSYWLFDGQTRGTDWFSGSEYGFTINNGASANTELAKFGSGSAVVGITLQYVNIIGRGYGQHTVVDRAIYAIEDLTSFNVNHCYIHDMYVPILTRNVDTVTFEYNAFCCNNSTAASHAEMWSDSGSDNVIFRYNKVKNPEGSAVFFIGNGGTRASADAGNTANTWGVYGNIFYYDSYVTASGNSDGVAGVVYCAWDASQHNWCSNWVFYNNTINNFSYGTESSRLFFENVTGVTQTLAKNNLWNNNDDAAGHFNVTLAYNYYRNTVHTAESNEQVGVTDPFVDEAGEDFHLVGATTAGLTLSSPYDTDLDGVTRNAGGIWDRGAYEFGSGCTPHHLLFDSQPSNALIGQSLGTITTQVVNSVGALCTDATNTVTLSKTAATCTGMTLNGTVSGAASAGVFTTTNVNMTVAAGSCSLDAAASGLTGATSNAFTISAAPAGSARAMRMRH